MSCRDVREWLHRDASELDEAQRLLLDDHLAVCETCRGDRDRMRLVHRVGTSLPVPPPGAREYSRAIARALMEGPRTRSAPRRLSWWIAPLAGLVGVVVVAIVIATRHHDEAPPPREAHHELPRPPHPEPAAAPADVVEEGGLVGDASTIAIGAAVPANVALRTDVRTRVKLGTLRVVIAASSEIRWSATDRELVLERGMLDIETLAPGRARIVTPQFELELDDVALTVEPAEVRVRRGTTRVVDRSRKLLASLDGDGTWRPIEPVGKLPAGAKPAELLARARTQFAAKDYAGAERTATRALTNATRLEQAEARIFLADVAQAAGKLDVAVARYDAVAATYAVLPVAESALYDAARIELQRAHATDARRLLDRYLIRYPSGRYADDVRRELAKLP